MCFYHFTYNCSVLCQCHVTYTSMSRQCHVNANSMPRQCHANATPMPRQCHANATPMPRQCHANATPMPRQCHLNPTPLPRQWSILYINDFSKATDLLFSILFADDTRVFIEGTAYSRIIKDMNTELEKVDKWLKSNKLSVYI